MATIKSQLDFLRLFIQTTPTQKKALLRTITLPQIKVLGEIAYNIVKSTIRLTPSDKAKLRRQKDVIHALATKTLGYKRKRRYILDKPKLVTTLVTLALNYLKPVL